MVFNVLGGYGFGERVEYLKNIDYKLSGLPKKNIIEFDDEITE